MKLGLLHSTIREEEKLLLCAARDLGVDSTSIDVRETVLNPERWSEHYDVALERCLSRTIGYHAVMFFESMGVKVVNSLQVAENCENKMRTSLLLRRYGVPTPPFALAFDETEAKQAVEQLGGYPVVLKPVSGSWGRLLAKVNDDDALEALIEQKLVMGSPIQKPLYLQKYLAKRGRDIRVAVVGKNVPSAIYRYCSHWITNMARGAHAEMCPVDEEMKKIALQAAAAVGGGFLGVDLFETEDGYMVNEVNHTPEFKNVQRVTGVNVAREVISYCMEVAAE
jgi:[lysine-biosynthesis-protein LysW]--L-2-aminoadipate ligase